MGIKSMLSGNQNLIAQTVLAMLIVVSLHSNTLLSAFLGIGFAMLIIDTKSNMLGSERLLFKSPSESKLILSEDGFCALRRAENGYYAIAKTRLSDTSNKKLDKEGLESIISNSNSPFNFIISVERVNTKRFMEKLLTKKHMVEISLSRLDRSSAKASAIESRLRAELSYLKDEISDFLAGGTPVKVQYYISVSEYGENAHEAQNSAKMAIKHISNLFDSVLGTSSSQVKGAELLAQ
ncbi:hypothetical protein M1583_02595 [Candidatus Marsarchaeota archaeon]|nr:hypothetical protein [Candidatus Marsarchaeota archaeon]